MQNFLHFEGRLSALHFVALQDYCRTAQTLVQDIFSKWVKIQGQGLMFVS